MPECDPFSTGMPQMVQVPGFSNMWHITSNCSHFSREKVSMSISFFYHRWVAEFEDTDRRLLRMLNDLMIEWSYQKKLVSGYTLNGDKINSSPALGLVLTLGMIWINVNNKSRICETSLIHELVHLALISQGYRGDADHEGNIHPGWYTKHTIFINTLNTLLCEFGL